MEIRNRCELSTLYEKPQEGAEGNAEETGAKKDEPKNKGGMKKKINNVFSVIKKMLTDPEEEEEEITDEK